MKSIDQAWIGRSDCSSCCGAFSRHCFLCLVALIEFHQAVHSIHLPVIPPMSGLAQQLKELLKTVARISLYQARQRKHHLFIIATLLLVIPH
jgi:hypothetical protein